MASGSRTSLPPYLRQEQERIEAAARAAGLDFFPVIFEMLSYDQINEIAAYGGFPNRYPHWRFGMDYETNRHGERWKPVAAARSCIGYLRSHPLRSEGA